MEFGDDPVGYYLAIPDHFTPLHCAAASGNVELMDFLISGTSQRFSYAFFRPLILRPSFLFHLSMSVLGCML